MTDVCVYPKGSLIFFTSGSYSDYRINGVMIALQDCNLKALAKEQLDSWTPKNEYDYINTDQFVAWLVKNGYIEQSDYSEVYVADWSLEEFIE